MKRLIVVILAFCATQSLAQEGAMESWQKLLNQKGLADYFKGTFETLGIFIKETNETFTVHHQGDHFELSKGVDSSEVDYLVELKPENINNMEKYGADGEVSEMESYHIMSVLFTPLTESALNNSILTDKRMLRKGGVEEHIQVVLYSPGKRDSTTHTLVFANDQWLLGKGLLGTPQRRFELMPGDAVLYQRQLFAAQKDGSNKAWKEFGKWYKIWRQGVSVEIEEG